MDEWMRLIRESLKSDNINGVHTTTTTNNNNRNLNSIIDADTNHMGNNKKGFNNITLSHFKKNYKKNNMGTIMNANNDGKSTALSTSSLLQVVETPVAKLRKENNGQKSMIKFQFV